MFRTVCFGVNSAVVNTWISSTAPVSDATIFADKIPGNVANNSSARRIGNTLPAMDGELDNEGDEFAGPGNGVSVCLTVEHDNLSVVRHRLCVRM
jgi:hypothetical protein